MNILLITGVTNVTIFSGCTRGIDVRTVTLGVDTDTGSTNITASSDIRISRFDSAGVIKIDSEWIKYTGLSSNGTQFTGCSRGQYGSSAATHTTGVTIYQGLASQHDANTIIYGGVSSHNAGVEVYQPLYSANSYQRPLLTRWNNNPVLFYAPGGYGSNIYKWKYFNGTNWVEPSYPDWWSANTKFDYGVNGNYNFSVTVTDDNYIHCATWQPNSGVRVRSHDNTTTSDWSAWISLESPLATPIDNGITPTITTDGVNLWCFWNKYITTDSYDIVYKKGTKSGSNWVWDSTATNVTTNGYKNVGVDTCIDSEKVGVIPVIWTEGTASPYNVKLERVIVPSEVVFLILR